MLEIFPVCDAWQMAVFFSFHYARDNWRVQQVLQMGALEGQTINAQKSEEVKRQGDDAIKKWIADQMAYKSTVVVLVGAETASRRWVRHEIGKAWDEKRPLVGVRIHGLEDVSGRSDAMGANPVSAVQLQGGGTVGDFVTLHNPSSSINQSAYSNIKQNLTTWVAGACKRS